MDYSEADEDSASSSPVNGPGVANGLPVAGLTSSSFPPADSSSPAKKKKSGRPDASGVMMMTGGTTEDERRQQMKDAFLPWVLQVRCSSSSSSFWHRRHNLSAGSRRGTVPPAP